ncbi:MAG: hypothetical protein WA364_21125, partial [Candidatus Nitrosopolaris sp.]
IFKLVAIVDTLPPPMNDDSNLIKIKWTRYNHIICMCWHSQNIEKWMLPSVSIASGARKILMIKQIP